MAAVNYSCIPWGFKGTATKLSLKLRFFRSEPRGTVESKGCKEISICLFAERKDWRTENTFYKLCIHNDMGSPDQSKFRALGFTIQRLAVRHLIEGLILRSSARDLPRLYGTLMKKLWKVTQKRQAVGSYLLCRIRILCGKIVWVHKPKWLENRSQPKVDRH